jgi:spore maturation protein CgeB
VKIFSFGSSLTSGFWNGAATYYRGIYRNLHLLGYDITFAQPDIYDRRQHQDCPQIAYAKVLNYVPGEQTAAMLQQAAEADLVVKHSGVGAEDELLERAVIELKDGRTRVVFWDVDAPATLARVEDDRDDPFRALIPRYDFVLTYGGGDAVVTHYQRLGAKACFPIYNGLDPQTHHPVPPDPAFVCDLAFVGHRLPDRERRVDEFFFAAAEYAPEMKFLLGGEGWRGKPMPRNVRWIGHVAANEHNPVNCSARAVLNVNRESMARVGFSPPTRVFEAAGAAACVITDAWAGIEQFFAPGEEILVARSAADVVHLLHNVDEHEARAVGGRMRVRALRDHSYAARAAEVDAILRRQVLMAEAVA